MLELFRRIKRLVANLPLYYRVFGVVGIVDFFKLRYAQGSAVMPLSLRGLPSPVWLRSGTTDMCVMREVFIEREYDTNVELRPKVIIDAGANVGLTSVFYARKYPDAMIYAIEPEEGNFAVLQRNAKVARNIVPIHAALWHEDTELQLCDPGRGDHGFVTSDAAEQDKSVRHRVSALSIPGLMSKFGVAHIDILKVDIEGAEKEVFQHAKAWIDCVDLVIVELHERFKTGCIEAVLNATDEMTTVYEYGCVIARLRMPQGQEKGRHGR